MFGTIEQLARNLVPYLKPYFVSLDTTPVYVGAKVYRTTNQSIPNAMNTAIAFDAELYDTDGLHDTGSNTTRLTCTRAGVYLISGSVRWAMNSTGIRYAQIMLNGTTYIASTSLIPVGADSINMIATTLYQLSVGDYVELMAYQASGGALNAETFSVFGLQFGMHRLA